MRELFIPNDYARTHIDHDGDTSSGLRIFRDSPETVTVQVRTHGSTNGLGRSKGKARPAYSTVALHADQIQAVINQLTKLKEELR